MIELFFEINRYANPVFLLFNYELFRYSTMNILTRLEQKEVCSRIYDKESTGSVSNEKKKFDNEKMVGNVYSSYSTTQGATSGPNFTTCQ